MTGVSLDFWLCAVKFLDKKYGERLMGETQNEIIRGLLIAETAYIELPKPEPKPKRKAKSP